LQTRDCSATNIVVSVIAISGSASGIGAATRQRLEEEGNRVVGIDIRDAEVIADLASQDGRRAAIAALRERTSNVLDRLVVCAGLGPQTEPVSSIVSVNYFGALALLAGLREALAAGEGAAAVAVSSNSASIPGMESPLVDACLRDDEDEARHLASQMSGQLVYGSSKLALARWVRRNATLSDWAGAGIRLNAVAPGAVRTPLLDGGLQHPDYGPAIRNYPIPLGGFGRPEQVAAAIAFLLSSESSYCCGTILYVDGGTDAMARPNSF
jgi:NAD(P)-dependent dehydrogenase (short-subunit alcohol dehydrogenase family)